MRRAALEGTATSHVANDNYGALLFVDCDDYDDGDNDNDNDDADDCGRKKVGGIPWFHRERCIHGPFECTIVPPYRGTDLVEWPNESGHGSNTQTDRPIVVRVGANERLHLCDSHHASPLMVPLGERGPSSSSSSPMIPTPLGATSTCLLGHAPCCH
mmetsp:Transcript_11117/g.20282  ORF Transcript_11117/g.20282 Transcript_11117/m.20282 type:complete len:157 (+) Transcript_11117:1559-2029(+)